MRKSSDLITSSKSILTKGGNFYGMTVFGMAGGLNEIRLFHDPLSAKGEVLDMAVVVSGGNYHSDHGEGIYCCSGLYAEVTGNLQAIVWSSENPLIT